MAGWTDNIELIFDKTIKDVLNYSVKVKDMPKFRGSSLPFCPVKFILALLFPEYALKDDNFSYRFFTEIGTVVHSLLQKGFARSNKLFGNWSCECGNKTFKTNEHICKSCQKEMHYEELSFYEPETGFSGHADGILLLNNRRYLLEIKTCGNSTYDKIKESGLPIWYHMAQAGSYIYMLRNSKDYQYKDIDSALFLYISRDNPHKYLKIVYKAPPDAAFATILKIYKDTEAKLKAGDLDKFLKVCHKDYGCAFETLCNQYPNPDFLKEMRVRWEKE